MTPALTVLLWLVMQSTRRYYVSIRIVPALGVSREHGPLLKTELWSCLVMTVYHFKVQGGGTGIPRVPPGAEKINMTHVNVVQNGSIET